MNTILGSTFGRSSVLQANPALGTLISETYDKYTIVN